MFSSENTYGISDNFRKLIYHRLQNINFVSQLKEELRHSNPARNIANMKISEDLKLPRRRVPDSYIG